MSSSSSTLPRGGASTPVNSHAPLVDVMREALAILDKLAAAQLAGKVA